MPFLEDDIGSKAEPEEGMDSECDNSTMIYFPTTFDSFSDSGASSSTAPPYVAYFTCPSDLFVIPTGSAPRVRKRRIRIGK